MKTKTFEGMPIVYQNKRVLIVDVVNNPQFSLLNRQYVLWDKYCQLQMGWADIQSDGSYKGVAIYGQHDIRFDGKTLKELAVNGLYEHKWILRN
jgi:uncharacterized protein YbdZ (MbtH family)